jgi:CBS domain-containing protein
LSIDDLLRDLAKTLNDVPGGTGEELHEEFIRACRRVDEDPREQQRIDDIADLLDAEQTLYAQASVAASRGDTDTAVPLLRQCAEAGTGEAAWLLAQLLEDAGNTAEAMIWYQHARADGDTRADEKLAALTARPCPYATLADSPQEDHTATTWDTPVIFVSHSSELRARPDCVSMPAAASPADPATDDSGFYRRLLAWLLLRAADSGNVPGKGLLTTSVPSYMVFSDPGSDHLASFAEMWCAIGETHNYLAHDTSWVKARMAVKLTKMLRAREQALVTECTFPLLVYCRAAESQPAAKWALRWRLLWEDYTRPCPVNLARLYTAAGWPASEPTVADVMLPPSEVPECKPDTTVIQALERLVQSGTQALPVCQMTRVVGIVTLADLARYISDRQGAAPVTETVRALMRPATIVPPGTPLPAIAQAIADDGIIVVSGSGDQPDGYLTAESVLTQVPPGTSARPAVPDRPPLLIPGAGAVLLDRGR